MNSRRKWVLIRGKGLYVSVALLALVLWEPAYAAKRIIVLATGGTIAGSAETRTEAAYTSGQVGMETLLAAVPQLGELATVSGEQLANVGSRRTGRSQRCAGGVER